MKKEEILERFVCTPSRVAVVGASPREGRPVFRVMNYLAGAGFTLYPVNPGYAGTEILGRPCAAGLPFLEEAVDVVALFLSAKQQGTVAADLEILSYRPVSGSSRVRKTTPSPVNWRRRGMTWCPRTVLWPIT